MELASNHLLVLSEAYGRRTNCFRSNLSLPSSVETGRFTAWDTLPEELVARILTLLPFSSIYLARGVCRKWRSIVWSPLFFNFCKLQPSRMPWMLEFQQHMYNQVWAYDLAGCQWFHVNLLFLPENASVVAAAGGLICLGRVTEEGYILFLCNPLTKAWKKLPSIPVQPGLVMIDVDEQSNHYKVVAMVFRGQLGAGSARPTGSVFLYDSKVQGWKETSGMPRELHPLGLWDATVCDGFLYCLTVEQGIKAYDLDHGVWSPLIIDGPNHANHVIARFQRRINRNGLQPGNQPFVQDSYILNRQGQLLMVTSYNNPEKVVVSEFDVNSRSWRWVDHSTAAAGGVICAGRFSSLWFHMPPGGNKVYLTHSEKNRHYIATPRSWHQLPKSPLTRHKIQGGEIMVKGLWFEPRLDATI